MFLATAVYSTEIDEKQKDTYSMDTTEPEMNQEIAQASSTSFESSKFPSFLVYRFPLTVLNYYQHH